jgi:nicotinamide mononucleotide adenylyltransferase
MKKFRQLVKELPSKKVIFAFGRFQPPTTGHELLVNAVKKIAFSQKADHVIFASRTQDKKTNPLQVDRKVYYLKRMFPATNFVAAGDNTRTFIEAAYVLSKKYKHLVMVAGSDRVAEYKKVLEKYNGNLFTFDTIEVVSAGDRDPDSDTVGGMSGTKMREAAKKNDFALFKKGLPYTLTELDSKRLMNEIRQGLGLDIVKEHVKFETNELREKYFAGEIFHVGEIVECQDMVLKIVKRGSNHLLLQTEEGNLVSKWPQDLAIAVKEFKEKECQMGCKCSKCSASDKPEVKKVGHTLGANSETHRHMKIKHHLGEDTDDINLTDIEIDEMVNSLTEDDIIDLYEDEELVLIDEDDNTVIAEIAEETINEVLSRAERIRAKVRFARTEAKRERKIKIALKTHSSSATLNKRARRMAVTTLKKRIAKRPLENLSVSEKERLEKVVGKNKNVLNRIAMKMVPKVKQIETQRLSHRGYTKGE